MISEIGKKHMQLLFAAKNEQHAKDMLQDVPKSELMLLLLDARAIGDVVLARFGVNEAMLNEAMDRLTVN